MTQDKKLKAEKANSVENNTTDQKAPITYTNAVNNESKKEDEEDTGWVAVGSGLGIDE